MASLKNILKIRIKNFFLLLGIGLFTYNLFNFGSGSDSLMNAPAYYYFYSKPTLFFLSIGAIFITVGLLKLRKKKSED